MNDEGTEIPESVDQKLSDSFDLFDSETLTI